MIGLYTPHAHRVTASAPLQKPVNNDFDPDALMFKDCASDVLKEMFGT